MEKVIFLVLKKFFVEINIYVISPLSGGLINDSFLVKTDKGRFVLQKINQNVFKNITALVENKSKVIDHLKRKNFPTANFIQTLENKSFCNIDADTWQISDYIPSKSIYKLNSQIAFNSGKLLAMFHQALLDFPLQELQYSISDFHNTEKRFFHFKKAVLTASTERREQAKDEIDFLLENYHKIELVVEAINKAKIPVRVVHNDTKVANILFDAQEHPICFIDFDTVMPGSILHDIGDALRSGTNRSDENEQDINKVVFEGAIYDSFIEGYLSIAQSFISETELQYIHKALPLILIEQASRFLADFLNNDTYYPIDYPLQNLNRARTQLKMFKDFDIIDNLSA